MSFLGHVISQDGVFVDPKKIESIVDCPRPTDVVELRSFLSLVGYYRNFVEGLSTIALSLSCLTQKHVKFEWTPKC